MPLAFLHGDVNWQRAYWRQDLESGLRLSHKFGARFGIINDGSPTDADSVAWTDNALRHADDVEKSLGLLPDDTIIQSWMLYPDRMLPPSAPGTLTYVVLRYVRTHR